MPKIKWLLYLLVVVLAVSVVAEPPLNGGDANCDQVNNVADLVVVVDYLFKGGAEPCSLGTLTSPVAAGVIGPGGEIVNGTGNFSCAWNGVSSRYEIAIDGESYFYADFVTHIDPISAPRMSTTAGSEGKLVVILYDLAGDRSQAYFSFTTYKL